MSAHDIEEKLKKARNIMQKESLTALYIPTHDPHGTEYLPEHWALRAYMSGFKGSAGTLIVTMDNAYLWVDSRYWIEAEKKLENTPITVMRLGAEKVPNVLRFLCAQLKKNNVVGFDPQMISVQLFNQYNQEFNLHKIVFKSVAHLADLLWSNRPAKPCSKIVDFDLLFAGESRLEKIKKIQSLMQKQHATDLLVTSLYDLAWLFNLRGEDTPYTPLFLGYALISLNSATLFVQKKALSANIKKILTRDHVELREYHEMNEALASLPKNAHLLYSQNTTSVELNDTIAKKVKTIPCVSSMISEEKSIKNAVELNHLNNAMIHDGVAMLRFYIKFKSKLKKNEKLTEVTLANLLDEERKKMPNNRGISFASIVAYNANAAMCHYHANEENAAEVTNEGVLLIDSGGQYLTGTTDITRTFALGKNKKLYRQDYTLVLKGHLAVARAVFPSGTKGNQIDVLAHQALWNHGLDFGHGTGHGIGFYLNVHEGPCGISPNAHTPLKIGQCITNEPGLYREGIHGIRIENVVTVCPAQKTKMGNFLKFKNLTLFPYDLKSIEINLLTQEEIQQINTYHERVYETLAPLLDETEKKHLSALTQLI